MTDPIVTRNKRNFERFQQEVIVGGDMSLLPELLAPTMRVLRAGNDSLVRLSGKEVPEGRVWTHEQFRKNYEAAVGDPSGHRRTIDEIHGEGNVVWARWTIEHEHHDGRYGVPPTGRPLSLTEAGMIRFDDEGRMVEGWFMSDPFEALAQIGATVTIAPADDVAPT